MLLDGIVFPLVTRYLLSCVSAVPRTNLVVPRPMPARMESLSSLQQQLCLTRMGQALFQKRPLLSARKLLTEKFLHPSKRRIRYSASQSSTLRLTKPLLSYAMELGSVLHAHAGLTLQLPPPCFCHSTELSPFLIIIPNHCINQLHLPLSRLRLLQHRHSSHTDL